MDAKEAADKTRDILKDYDPAQPAATADALRQVWRAAAPELAPELAPGGSPSSATGASARRDYEAVGTPVPVLRAMGQEVGRVARKRVGEFLPLARLLWDRLRARGPGGGRRRSGADGAGRSGARGAAHPGDGPDLRVLGGLRPVGHARPGAGAAPGAGCLAGAVRRVGARRKQVAAPRGADGPGSPADGRRRTTRPAAWSWWRRPWAIPTATSSAP